MTLSPADAPILRAAEMRAAEKAAFATGVSQDTLMERAGTAVAQQVRRITFGRPILVLAGPGNNGGDAFVVARLLQQWGYDVTVAALPAKPSGAAARMAAAWTGPIRSIEDAEPRPILVDGLFGTGVTRPLDPQLADRLATLSDHAFVVAIDLPSGVDSDAEHAFAGAGRADLTVALGALKPAHGTGPDAGRVGHVVLADLGIPIPATVRTIRRPKIDPPARATHKYSRGLIAVLGGAMPGAARLAARAALSAGAGYVVLTGDAAGQGGPDALVRRDDPPALLTDERLAAVLVGPGLGRDDRARALLDAALATHAPLVIDGDAISLLGAAGVARIAARTAPTWLTPHEGEFARMFPAKGGNKIDRTRHAALQARATIVHKGPDTVIACPQGTAILATHAPSWLSTAGTGDVLAGTLAARLRPGGTTAAEQAVWLHGRAARLADPAFVADALIDHLGQAIAECR
ncbi:MULTISPECIES: NAD(P)H-hydrate epimerase [unclassified Sphingomonas]|uniref:NAD(P)H-hydrate epimerase n=1 Tax=unclassified Sphingomonas TaxID=196159 RepID=UPI000A9BAACC|nr:MULTISPECIES: NAD(P)H-hydrate epimerase [unclassified Sphingomonas]